MGVNLRSRCKSAFKQGLSIVRYHASLVSSLSLKRICPQPTGLRAFFIPVSGMLFFSVTG